MRLFFIVMLILGLVPWQGFSQSEDVGAWYMYFGTNRLTDKWSIHSEAQFRFFKVSSDLNQVLLRIGANYHLQNGAMVTLGYAYIPDWEANTGNQLVSENRIFQQFILRNELGRVRFEHRYRLEQRFLNVLASNEYRYENRARYRLYLAVPFNNKTQVPKTVFYAFYNEIFIDIDETPFNQNRFYHALGYQISKTTSLQIGYLLLSLADLATFTADSGVRHIDNFQLAVFVNPDFRK